MMPSVGRQDTNTLKTTLTNKIFKIIILYWEMCFKATWEFCLWLCAWFRDLRWHLWPCSRCLKCLSLSPPPPLLSLCVFNSSSMGVSEASFLILVEAEAALPARVLCVGSSKKGTLGKTSESLLLLAPERPLTWPVWLPHPSHKYLIHLPLCFKLCPFNPSSPFYLQPLSSLQFLWVAFTMSQFLWLPTNQAPASIAQWRQPNLD